MMSKSKAAFLFSADRLKPTPKNRLYLWTFTFAEVYHVRDAAGRWTGFLTQLRQLKASGAIEGFQGLRVFEMHPGGHGLHIHVITSNWWDVDVIRSAWLRGRRVKSGAVVSGGRIHVKWVPAEARGYLGKYLTKKGRPDCLKGFHLWGAFGDFPRSRVRDITVESSFTRVYSMLKATLSFTDGSRFEDMRWYERMQACQNLLLFRPWSYGLGGYSESPPVDGELQAKKVTSRPGLSQMLLSALWG
jgi:hypothetical protein